MKPHLWIAYDYLSIPECLAMLDTILAKHPEPHLIHEIGRPTIINAALAGVPIVAAFRQRLTNGQLLVADFKGFDVPYLAEAQPYYAAGADLVTVMATAPDEAIREALDGAQADNRRVAFDLMSHQSDDDKVQRAKALVRMGANLISCHTGWSEQATGKTPEALLEQVYQALDRTAAQIIAMGGLQPKNVKGLREYMAADKLFAIVAGSAITRSHDPNAVIDHFLEEIAA